jgi:hypothetical protein
MLAEGGKSLLELWIGSTIGYGTLHEQSNAIAYKAAHVVNAMLGHATGLQGIVDRCCQVTQGVQQCTVQIEDKCLGRRSRP